LVKLKLRDGDFFFTTHFVALCPSDRRLDRRMGVTGTIKETKEKLKPAFYSFGSKTHKQSF